MASMRPFTIGPPDYERRIHVTSQRVEIGHSTLIVRLGIHAGPRTVAAV